MRILLLFFSLLLCLGCASQQRQAEPPAKNNEIVIGALFEKTGKYAEYGLPAIKAVEMAVSEINAAGGINGRNVRLIIADTKSDESESAKGFSALSAENEMLSIIGPNFSAMGIVINPLAEARRIPFVATWATNPRVTVDDSGRTRPFAFRACFNDSFQGGALGHFAAKLNARRAATLIDDTAYYSQALATYFERSFFKEGGQVVYKDGYDPNAADFPTQCKTLLASKPDIIFLPGFHPEVARIIREVRTLGYVGPILGADSWEENLLRPLLPGDFLNNTYYSAHFSAEEDTPVVRDFLTKFRAYAPTTEATQSAVLAYDATQLLFIALKNTGQNPDRLKLRDELEKIRDFPAISGQITIDSQHNGGKSAVIIEIQNGKSRFLQRVTADKDF